MSEADQIDSFTRRARKRVDAFIDQHPEYTRDGVQQPGQGSTNRVVFARRADELVVFKLFCEIERKERETFAIRHWSSTGLVPELIWDDDPELIVISHIPGHFLGQFGPDDPEIYREVGKALATLANVPLSASDRAMFESRFYRDIGSLESYLNRVLQLCRSIHARDPDFRDPFWGRSLDFIENQLAYIFALPRLLYSQDAGNLHIRGNRFIGFFDLEMCRVGCIAMQLAAAPGITGGGAYWNAFRKGWEETTGTPLTQADLDAVAAGRQLLTWREICRYMSYDGTPGTGYTWADPADPVACRAGIDSINSTFGVEI